MKHTRGYVDMNVVRPSYHPQQRFLVPNLNRQYRLLFGKEIAAKDLYRAISRASIEIEVMQSVFTSLSFNVIPRL